jgi:CRP/FNR family cyclic AMP-dependent transcriptional regulator
MIRSCSVADVERSLQTRYRNTNRCRIQDIAQGFLPRKALALYNPGPMPHPFAAPTHRFMHALPWFRSLCGEEQQQLLDSMPTREGSKGEVILPSGEPMEGWWAVLSGLVMLRSTTPQRRSSAFIGVPEGEWFGEGTALKEESRRYEVVALRPTKLLCLPLPQMKQLRETSLSFNHFLTNHLNMRLGQAMTLIEVGRIHSAEFRVAQLLSPLFWRDARNINLTQEEIGYLSGLSRQTVNRVLQSLEKQGIVSTSVGKVFIRDAHGLNFYLMQQGNETKAAPKAAM